VSSEIFFIAILSVPKIVVAKRMFLDASVLKPSTEHYDATHFSSVLKNLL